MNEEALRALVRETIARRMSAGPEPGPTLPAAPVALLSQPSQYRYALPESDGPCLIEPRVACNHCGYCQSHGH
jgi:hypothetical protein